MMARGKAGKAQSAGLLRDASGFAADSGWRTAQAFSEKFYVSLDMAKRLIELHQAAMEREVKNSKKQNR